MPHNPLDCAVAQVLAQRVEGSRAVLQHCLAVLHKHMKLETLRVALHLRATKFIGAFVPAAPALPCFAVAGVFGSVSHRNPSGPVSGVFVWRVLRRLEVFGRLLPCLGVKPFVQFAVAHHAARPVKLPRCHTFTRNNPLGARYNLVAHQPVAVVVPLKQRNSLFHLSSFLRSYRMPPNLSPFVNSLVRFPNATNDSCHRLS